MKKKKQLFMVLQVRTDLTLELLLRKKYEVHGVKKDLLH